MSDCETFTNSHYSQAQNIPELIDLSAIAAKEVFRICSIKEWVPIFCYRGLSGTAHATAIAMQYYNHSKSFGMVYIRKEHEKCHAMGRKYEQSMRLEVGREMMTSKFVLVFCDDLVDSGETRTEVLHKTLWNLWENTFMKKQNFEDVSFIQSVTKSTLLKELVDADVDFDDIYKDAKRSRQNLGYKDPE